MIEVAQMPVSSAQPRHRWPPKESWNVVIAQDSRDGNEHHVRQCLVCEIAKITVIDGRRFAWHEWVTPRGVVWVGAAVWHRERSPMTADLHLAETFRQAESSHPDLMEPYAMLLVEAESVDDRVSIMRRGLRETIAGRFPMADAQPSPRSAQDDSLASCSPSSQGDDARYSRNPQVQP